jgi:hypothetical protein
MNRYLAKLASLDRKRAYPSNPQNPQNPPTLGFEGFEGSLGSAFLPSAIPPTELPEPAGDAAIEEEAGRDRLKERAAIFEFDEGLPRTEAEAAASRETAADVYAIRQAERDAAPYASSLAALRAKCPAFVSEDRWRQANTDASAFATKWGAEAQTFGWTEPELFGLHPVPKQPAANCDRLARLDDMGLIWLLRGRPVVALTATEASFRCLSGAILSYRRERRP